jgi:hypothetical protein
MSPEMPGHDDLSHNRRLRAEQLFHESPTCFNPESPSGGAMIAKRFGFTRNFLRERNTGLYCRLKKISCGFKDRARACLLMDFAGSTLPGVDFLIYPVVYESARACHESAIIAAPEALRALG